MTTCSGSASFDVAARLTTQVTVKVTCRTPPKNGSGQVNGTLDVCPVIDELGANATAVYLGSSLLLTAAAHDGDAGPAPLTYAWSASSGSVLPSASGTSATFTCSAPGAATATLRA